ncbi:haloacid dehalogenase type II [Arthrobacter globiformis]|uniref:Haloacid dehalogenase type II n=1 Tax=Arthrobacter globiformis TaxID=1665 RepID=A0A328HJK6_ARTGO|nr:haloacid dehalogenase type II [Arthrobacter globiformis]RAM38384.1 haloacid dehalogenase type II [Arthrobacter globiformis]
MPKQPTVIIFDVNETLSDLSPLADRFAETGAPRTLAKLWFATLLRDGFALAAAGDNKTFAEIGAEALRGLLTGSDLNRETDAAVDHIMQGMAGLGLHPDVPDGVSALKASGYRLVTLTNGSASVAERLFNAAGIRDSFDLPLSVEDAPAWKPARAAYDHAARTCGADPEQLLLAAVHPWDIHGAARAGLQTAWINRSGAPYPAYFTAPDCTASSLPDLAGALASAAG